MKLGILVIISCLALISCEDESSKAEGTPPDTAPARLHVADMTPAPDENVPILDWSPATPPEPDPPDMSHEERCALVPVTETQAYCRCYPQCCRTQRWYCPPNPQQTIEAMEVVVEICDEDKTPCEYGVDEACPPPEIIDRSECYTAHECPPGSTGEFLQWFECQLEDGRFGQQRVLCDKGNLIHGPCQPCDPEQCNGLDDDCDNLIDEGRFACETDCGPGWGFCVDGEIVDCNADQPGEEVCDLHDNDCDGAVDEGQTNECGQCGPLPAEECNNIDDDCDNDTDEELVRECNTACENGIETCSAGNWISCTARRPIPEAQPCDGEDNDCDGLIDEGLECECTLDDVGALFPCSEPPLTCGQGFKTCECVDPNCEQLRVTDCQALCVYLPPNPDVPCDPLVGMIIEAEVCNNFDEDCDVAIDEGLVAQCYTGPENTLNVGVCAPGNSTCESGSWGSRTEEGFIQGLCAGEVTPSEEICDGADNDCDGIVDYGEEIADTDILFIVDWSGSMDDEIGAVKTALNRFATQFQAEEALQWGLIVGPKEAGPREEHLFKISDISPFADFLAAFAGLGNEGMDTSNEMLRDALYLALRNISANANFDVGLSEWHAGTGSNPPKEEFVVNWRAGVSKIVIIFSDEDDQSFLRPQIERELIGRTIDGTPNLKLYTFTAHNRGSYAEWAARTGGVNFDLTSNQNRMYENLMSIIDEACLPRPEPEAGARAFPLRQRRNVLRYIYASKHSYKHYNHHLGICL